MRKLILGICLYFSLSVYSFSQINVSLDRDCLEHNAAIISKAMIETFGEDSIKYFLYNNIHMVFSPQVDSLGLTLKIHIIRSKWAITNDFTTSIESYLIENKIHFYICYTKDPPDIQKSQIIAYAREHFKKNSTHIIAFGFPGALMTMYDIESKKALKEGINLSKYDYLLMQISKYTLE